MSFAQVSSTTAISAYALDCFPHHAALSSSWINFWRTTGGFCVTYFQTQVWVLVMIHTSIILICFQWVAKSGAAVTFGIQAAIIAFGFLFIIATQIMGRSWRAKYGAPVAEK
jgi:isoprenylcysteine carboxyl methyltransferase (ICMT) family protein YpbQ